MKQPLTKRQKEILDYVVVYTNLNGYSPTLSEIKDHFNLSSTSTVHEHLVNLESKGYLEKTSNTTRSIKVFNENYSNDFPKRNIKFFINDKLSLRRINSGKTQNSGNSDQKNSVYLLALLKTGILKKKGFLKGDTLVFQYTANFEDEGFYIITFGQRKILMLLRKSGKSLSAIDPVHNTHVLEEKEFSIIARLQKLSRDF